MIQEYIRALFLIFMAEMGDKTQILAMAFATQYNVGQVLLGVFIGSLLNHGLAVLLGSLLSSVIPLNTIQIIAGFSFIGFALWTLKFEKEEDEEETGKKGMGPVVTVAIAFFIGELGDKTQLTAITLAADAMFPLFILLGTVTGMIVTSGVGIFVGSKLGNRIPEFTIKIASAGIFLFFGISKLYTTLPSNYINGGSIAGLGVFLLVSLFFLLRPHIVARRVNSGSSLKQVALTLYENAQQIKQSIEDICLGSEVCGNCKGENCIIGHTKMVLNYIAKDDYDIPSISRKEFFQSLGKPFSKEKTVESLSMILGYLQEVQPHQTDLKQAIHEVRKDLELILFGQEISFATGVEQYLTEIKKINQQIGKEVQRKIFSGER